MKKLTILFLIALSFSSFARELTCIDKLLPFNRNSGLHQVTKDEWNGTKEVLDTESAKEALNFLVNSKLLCKTGEVQIKVFPVCNLLTADIPQSNTCFAFSNLGYFVISKDNGKNINFIFSRDKKFSETEEL